MTNEHDAAQLQRYDEYISAVEQARVCGSLAMQPDLELEFLRLSLGEIGQALDERIAASE